MPPNPPAMAANPNPSSSAAHNPPLPPTPHPQTLLGRSPPPPPLAPQTLAYRAARPAFLRYTPTAHFPNPFRPFGLPPADLRPAPRPCPTPPPPAPPPPPRPSAPDCTNFKDLKDKQREDPLAATVHGRKVALPDADSSRSLYALCRSWLRNGAPQEAQPAFGGVRLLPRPLPAAAVDGFLPRRRPAEEPEEEDEDPEAVEDLTHRDLLDHYVSRAKRVRTKLKEERLRRVERYKQRLSLLLPPPGDPSRSGDVVPSS